MSLISLEPTPIELKNSAELFYALRDQRTNLRIAPSKQTVPLSIVANIENASTVAGQQMLLTFVNTTLRAGRRFAELSIDVPDVPLKIESRAVSSRTLKKALIELSKKVDPHSVISWRQEDYGFGIALGNSPCVAPNPFFIGLSKSGVRVSRTPVESLGFENPIGAVIAANSGVAEVYKHFTPSTKATNVNDAVIAVPPIKRLGLGSLLLVGAGGISHGLGWVLQWIPTTGCITLVDFDPIETSNLNRYFCAFVDDITGNKPRCLATFLRNEPSLQISPVTGSYEELRDGARLDLGAFEHVIAAVDNVATRLEIQSDLPRSILNAGTSAWSFDASRHEFLSGACLGCLFPPMAGVQYDRRVRCGERPDGSEKPPVESYSFVNGLAGAYLTIQLAAVSNSHIAQNIPTRYHGSALRIDSVIQENREKDPQCVFFCKDPSVASYYEAKFPELVPKTEDIKLKASKILRNRSSATASRKTARPKRAERSFPRLPQR